MRKLAIIAVALVALAGCATPSGDDLVGGWEATISGYSVRLELVADGTATWHMLDPATTDTGAWSVDDGLLTICWDSGYTVQWDIDFAADGPLYLTINDHPVAFSPA